MLMGKRNLNFKNNYIPLIQNTLGVPLSTQVYKKFILAYKSLVQLERGFNDKKPLSAHIIGT